MNVLVKIVLGIVLVFGSAWWVLTGSLQYIGRSGVADLLTVINGIVPVLIFIFGIMIIWLELDELKIEKQLASEEKKGRRKR